MDIRTPITIYTVTDPLEAEVIHGALQAEGIACRVEGGRQAGLSGILEIDIVTHAEDEDRARRIIEQHEARVARRREQA